MVSLEPPPLVLGNYASPTEAWKKWEQQFSDYATVTHLYQQPAEVQVATFLRAIGPEATNILYNLNLSPTERLDLPVIKRKLTSYFATEKKNIVIERYAFNKIFHVPYETIDSFVDRVLCAATTCEFGEMKDELVRDKIVAGSRPPVRNKLLSERELTLNKAIEICRNFPPSRLGSWTRRTYRRDYTSHHCTGCYGREKTVLLNAGKKNELKAIEPPINVDDKVDKIKCDVMSPSHIKQEVMSPVDAYSIKQEMEDYIEIDNIKREIIEQD